MDSLLNEKANIQLVVVKVLLQVSPVISTPSLIKLKQLFNKIRL